MRFVTRRFLGSVLSLGILLAAVFFASRLTGDPTNLFLPLSASEELRQAFREQNGLDQPILVQFGGFIGGILQGDLGQSIWRGEGALELALAALPYTMELAILTMIIAVVFGCGLGLLAAIKPGSIFDKATSFVTTVGSAVPDFWLALVLVLIFARELHWLPTSGTGGVAYYILPLLTLAARPVGVLAQVTRSALLGQISEPYTVTALSKGLARREVLWHHTSRNAAIPVITVAGDLLVQMVNGVVVVEVVFGWPGIGSLTIDAIFNRDFAVVQACVVVVAVLVIIINLVVDLAYAVIDPRVRVS